MGILKDQFPTQVTKIEIALNAVPSKVYLRDNANGEIIYPTDNGTGTYTYTYTITSEQWDSNDPFRACLNLLPHTLKEAKVTVTLTDGKKTLFKGELPVAQFGVIFGLDPSLFTDKKNPSCVTFYPQTGAIRQLGK